MWFELGQHLGAQTAGQLHRWWVVLLRVSRVQRAKCWHFSFLWSADSVGAWVGTSQRSTVWQWQALMGAILSCSLFTWHLAWTKRVACLSRGSQVLRVSGGKGFSICHRAVHVNQRQDIHDRLRRGKVREEHRTRSRCLSLGVLGHRFGWSSQ